MLPKHWGSAESQFKDAVFGKTHKPPWFVNIEKASAVMDVRGIDWIAYIWHRQHPKPIRVPIQIKGSAEGVKDYYKRYPDAHRAGVIVLVVQRTDSPVYIIDRLVEKLHEVRQKETVDFSEYLKKISTRPLRRYESLIIAKMAQRHKDLSPEKQLGATPAE